MFDIIFSHFWGIVTYDDGTNAIFETFADARGTAYSYSSDPVASADALAQLDVQQPWLQDMLNLLENNIPKLAGEQTGPTKVVSSLIAKLHGRIARPNGTHKDWIVQYDPEYGHWIPNSGGDYPNDVSAWIEAYGSDSDNLWRCLVQ